MKPVQTLKRIFREQVRKAFDPMENIDLNKVVGWHKVGGSSIYGYYKDHQYENGYSSISKLGNGFAAIEPYTIDRNGNSVPSNILDRIYTPNTEMSAYDFREALAVTSLVHDKVRLRVHHRGTRVNADSITGFTFMEGFTEMITGGERLYKLQNGETLTDDEVLTLKSINPDNINGGFSPSRAARRWTRLDDYIADYQKGFFENGAVPSGQMIITAKTATEFNDIVDMIQAKHKGAGKNNNITYTHRPTDQNGSPLNSQIEWVPFSTQNKDMGLKEIFEQVNQKIDSAYGVPASIRGVNDKNTYASIRVDEVIFVKYALNPMSLKIWSKFTHELNRITGGTGIAITYDLEIPKIADEELINSQAKQADAETVATLTEQGYTLESAVDYVKTGLLESLVLGKAPDKDEPEVLSQEEARGTPEQPIDLYAKSLEEIKELLNKKFEKPEEPKLESKQLSEVDRELAESRIRSIVQNQLEVQVTRAIEQLDPTKKAIGDSTQAQDDVFVDEMMTVIMPVVAVYGSIQTSLGAEMVVSAGLSTEGIKRFVITEEQRQAYRKYLQNIATYFNEQTAEKIRNVLQNAVANQLPRAEIESGLRGIIKEQWRIDRLATTEINRAGGRASVMSMANIKADTGYDIQKTMRHNGSDAPCEFCAARLGDWFPVDKSMVEEGEIVKGVDGGEYINTWEDNYGNDIHANGHCSPIFRVKKG